MDVNQLPVECLAAILAFTSPKDACRSAAVSPAFRSAVDSDDLWIAFLPSDYEQIISQASPNLLLNSFSKKDLYFHLCDHLLFIGSGNSTFVLEKKSGKKCYMIGARDLNIVWGNSPQYWTWKSIPQSRFARVAVLNFVCWLEIRGKIEAKKLSPKTKYAAYLVFKLERRNRCGFDKRPVSMRIYFEGAEEAEEEGNMAILDPPPGTPFVVSRQRPDRLMEIEMGQIFNQSQDDNASIIFHLKEVDDYNVKCGLIVEGIEIRPIIVDP